MAGSVGSAGFGGGDMGPRLTLDQAREVVKKGVRAFSSQRSRILDAIREAGGDSGKLMALIMPLALEVQGPLLEEHGFEKSPMGVLQMIAALNMHALSDPDLKAQLDDYQAIAMGRKEPPKEEEIAGETST